MKKLRESGHITMDKDGYITPDGAGRPGGAAGVPAASPADPVLSDAGRQRGDSPAGRSARSSTISAKRRSAAFWSTPGGIWTICPASNDPGHRQRQPPHRRAGLSRGLVFPLSGAGLGHGAGAGRVPVCFAGAAGRGGLCVLDQNPAPMLDRLDQLGDVPFIFNLH